MKVDETAAARREFLNIGGGIGGIAEWTEIREAGVVQKDDHKIWFVFRRS
jgi:hypothetical protein